MHVITGKAQDQYWERTRYRDAHDPIAKAYAEPKMAYISRFANIQQSRILDVGCGTGVFTTPLSALAASVIGVDYSAHMLRGNRSGHLAQADAARLPFASGAFDLVFSANLLHHSAEPQAIVREMARVTKRYVVLVEPNRSNPLMFLFGVIVPEERGLLKFTRSYVSQTMQSCGLDIVRCAAMGMISQNNTPGFLIPYLKAFDRECSYGEYVVAVATKR